MCKTAVALGNFDGLHIGHKQVIKNALSLKNDGLLPCVMTFEEHPSKYFSDMPMRLIMMRDMRNDIVRENGLKPIEIPFGEVVGMNADEFVREILAKRLNAAAVCCGYNYRFGKNACADAQELKRICAEYGIKTVISGEVDFDGEPVSSTRIRELIEDGFIEKANLLIGRPFAYKLLVIRGDQRGRTLGAPTINQEFPSDLVVPKFGVYASRTVVDGTEYKSVTNIGIRPTIADEKLLSETNILDFSSELYGKFAEVRLIKYLRAEKKFASLDELGKQIKADADSAGKI